MPPGKIKAPKTVINNIIVDNMNQNINVTNQNNFSIYAEGDINGNINPIQSGPVTTQTSNKNY